MKIRITAVGRDGFHCETVELAVGLEPDKVFIEVEPKEAMSYQSCFEAGLILGQNPPGAYIVWPGKSGLRR